MHATSLIGTAILLNENREQLHGRVKLMWQPGRSIRRHESHDRCRRPENPARCALDLHVDVHRSWSPQLLQALHNFCGQLPDQDQGSGCHGSMPENSIDPLNVAIQIYNAIASMRFREIKGSEFLAMSITSISSGNSFNIIPDSVEMRYDADLQSCDHDYVVDALKRSYKEVASRTARKAASNR